MIDVEIEDDVIRQSRCASHTLLSALNSILRSLVLSGSRSTLVVPRVSRSLSAMGRGNKKVLPLRSVLKGFVYSSSSLWPLRIAILDPVPPNGGNGTIVTRSQSSSSKRRIRSLRITTKYGRPSHTFCCKFLMLWPATRNKAFYPKRNGKTS